MEWVQASMRLICRGLDWFVPAPMKRDGEALQRARRFVLSHLLGTTVGQTIPAYLYAIDPDPGYPLWVLAGSITVLWLYPLALKLTGQFVVVALVALQNLAFATLWGSYYWGGASSPFLPWLLAVALNAFFHLGAARRLRLVVLGLIALDLCTFYVICAAGGDVPPKIPLSRLEPVGITSTVCVAIYLSVMALYYANVVASRSELEREVENHRLTAIRLLEATAEAERANHAKSEFLARMSHELRIPLNAVIGYSEMLLEDAGLAGRSEQAADLEKINGSAKELLRLITALLDLAKIEAGRMEILVERIRLDELIADAIVRSAPLAASSGSELVFANGAAAGDLDGDPTKLREVLFHLLGNAAKFTRNGRITVAVERDARPGDERVRISVRDTGPGIPHEQLPLLFETFGDAEGSTSSKYGSRGLGLPLSRKLCRLMGGDITVESQPGRGSRFTVHLPATATAAAAADGGEAAPRAPELAAAE